MSSGRMTYPDVSLRGHHRVHGACRVTIFVSSSLGMGIAEQKLVRNPGHVKRLFQKLAHYAATDVVVPRPKASYSVVGAVATPSMHPMGT